MFQCAGVSATTGGEVRHEPFTPTTRTTLLTLPIQACTTFGSLFPACALASVGMANKAAGQIRTIQNLRGRDVIGCGVYAPPPTSGLTLSAARVGSVRTYFQECKRRRQASNPCQF